MSSPSLTIVHGTTDKPATTGTLIRALRDQDLKGQLLIGYPVIASPDGRYAIDALLVSPDHGLVCFDLVEGLDLGDHAARQDEAYNRLYARLVPHQGLVHRRILLTKIETLTYAPAVSRTVANHEHPVLDGSSLVPHVKQLVWESSTPELYDRTLSAIQSITAIRRPGGARSPGKPDSRAARLTALENSIATLDRSQSKAVIETVDGVQRIRGLAGSGKTIVLALKAAYLHARHPDWRIAVTFHTRSLKDHFTRLITNFSIEQTGEEPDWDRLRVVSSWGASGGADRDGVYYEFCRVHDLEYRDFFAAKTRFGFEYAFEGAVESALDNVGEIQRSYDAILVDEAQDFPPAFLRLCYEFLERPKRLVYAYDELQNLTNEGLPSPEEIFGLGNDGSRESASTTATATELSGTSFLRSATGTHARSLSPLMAWDSASIGSRPSGATQGSCRCSIDPNSGPMSVTQLARGDWRSAAMSAWLGRRTPVRNSSNLTPTSMT